MIAVRKTCTEAKRLNNTRLLQTVQRRTTHFTLWKLFIDVNLSGLYVYMNLKYWYTTQIMVKGGWHVTITLAVFLQWV